MLVVSQSVVSFKSGMPVEETAELKVLIPLPVTLMLVTVELSAEKDIAAALVEYTFE